MTTLFFATDVHGSDICWKKFINAGKFYKANILVLGGDISGKAVIPIIYQGNHKYESNFLEQNLIVQEEDEMEALQRKIKSRGYYPYLTNPDEISTLKENPTLINNLFHQLVIATVKDWIAYADEKLADTGIRCYVAPGNDDLPEIDPMFRDSSSIDLVEGEVIQIDESHEMISSGWSNPTPWHTYREEPESNLVLRYETMISRLKDNRNAIYNFHVPPYSSGLDGAPEMTSDLRPKHAGNSLVPVGSHAVRSVIEKFQPLLGLFGHIHEGKGTSRIGRTLCLNPGSMYEQGCLCGALLNLEPHRIKHHLLTTG